MAVFPAPPFPHRPLDHIPSRPPFHTARNMANNGRCGSTYTAHPLRERPLDCIPSGLLFHTARNMANNGRCGSMYAAHPCESAFWGTLPAGVFPQVYQVVCSKVLALCELGEVVRFTCERWGSGGRCDGEMVEENIRVHLRRVGEYFR